MKMYRSNFYIFKIFLILVVGLILMTLIARTGNCAVILHDDFDGPLEPTWTIQRGNAWTEGGWAILYDNVEPDPYRDSVIVAEEGANWSDYRFKTRFYARGGGNNWYNAQIYFRVQELYGWDSGTFYRANIKTPIYGYPSEGNEISLFKKVENVVTYLVSNYNPPSGVMHDYDNTIEVKVVGGQITILINDVEVIEVTDDNPIPTGGVALGAMFESRTDYDYVIVTPYYSCVGFESPVDNSPVTVKGKNRAIPFKAELEKNGTPITNLNIIAAPVIQVIYDSGLPGEEPEDVTEGALPAGQGTEGNEFVFTDEGKWQFNLKLTNYSAVGTYTVKMLSGDDKEYEIAPTCEAEFLIK